MGHPTQPFECLSPKPFWNAPTLAVFLSEYYAENGLRHARVLGAYFETLILHHLRVLSDLRVLSARLSFWRITNGQEVGLVVDHGRHLVGIEVKMSTKVSYGGTAALRQSLSAYPHSSGGLIVYQSRSCDTSATRSWRCPGRFCWGEGRVARIAVTDWLLLCGIGRFSI